MRPLDHWRRDGQQPRTYGLWGGVHLLTCSNPDIQIPEYLSIADAAMPRSHISECRPGAIPWRRSATIGITKSWLKKYCNWNKKYPICLKGKHACPPEDCRGVSGHYEFLEAIQDPKNLEHENMLE